MRIIGFALLTFLLASIAFLISNDSVVSRKVARITSVFQPQEMVFEPSTALPMPSVKNERVRFSPHGQVPILLTGLPARQSITFTLPKDSRIRSGHLLIHATPQVLVDTQAALRIQINGARRAEVLLVPQAGPKTIRIPLLPEDLLTAEMTVSFSLRGEGPNEECSSDRGVEAVVEIERTSGLFLALGGLPLSPRDQIAAWGQHVFASWSPQIDRQARVQSLLAATALHRQGLGVSFISASGAPRANDGMDVAQLREAASHLNTTKQARPDFFPRPLAKRNANTAARRFHLSTDWRYRYRLRDITEGVYPKSLELSLAFGGGMPGTRWSVFVTLNGHMVQAAHMTAGQTTYNTSIDLPIAFQGANNLLHVSLVSGHVPDRRCDTGPQLIAEMRQETHLAAGNVRIKDPMRDVHDVMANVGAVTLLGLNKLSALEATLTTRLLAEAMPMKKSQNPTAPLAQIEVLRREDVAKRVRSQGWYVFQDALNDEIAALSVTAAPSEIEDLTSPLLFHIRTIKRDKS